MKYTMYILLVLGSYHSNCQEIDSVQLDRSFSKGWVSSNFALSLQYGMTKYQLERINTDLGPLLGDGFSDYIGYFGVSASSSGLLGDLQGRSFAVDTHLDLMFYHSMPMVMEINDSTRYHMRGFHVGLDVCKDLFPTVKSVDLLLGLGFNTGRMVLANWDLTEGNKENRRNKYVNPFFSPKLSIETRFILFKTISMSIRSEIQLDITNNQWKLRNSNLMPLGNSSATGFNLSLTFGAGGR
jgi:hypothetical protein